MRVMTYIAALGLLAVGGCSEMGWGQSNNQSAPQRRSTTGRGRAYEQPTTCSPADTTCGTGIGNPSVQSPVQKRELNVAPQ